MGKEDQRAAVSISVTLSGQLITAALAMLAVEGGYIAFAFGNRVTMVGFGIVAILAASCFVISIFVAGKGITATRDSGYEGEWKIDAGERRFNQQAGLCLLGLILLGVMLALSGQPKQTEVAEQLSELKRRLGTLDQRFSTVESESKALHTKVTDALERFSAVPNPGGTDEKH